MAYTLGNMLADLYYSLGQATPYKASGGSTTTAINTNTGINDPNLQGAIFITETTDDLAPLGEYSEVTAFNSSTGTFTFDALTAAVGANDVFSFGSPLYPLQQMIEACNRGLRNIGDIDLVDTTTLDTADNQTEYDCELVWKRRTPLRIDIQTNITDANDNRWRTIYDWEFIPATAGTKGLIVFDEQLSSDRDVRVWYRDVHPRVSAYNDVVSEMIQPELAIAHAKVVALKWQVSRALGQEPGTVQLLNESQVDLQEVMQKFKTWQAKRTPEITTIPRGDYVDRGEPGKVSLS